MQDQAADLCLSDYGDKVRLMVRGYSDLCLGREYGDKMRMMVWDYADLCFSEYGDKVRLDSGFCGSVFQRVRGQGEIWFRILRICVSTSTGTR